MSDAAAIRPAVSSPYAARQPSIIQAGMFEAGSAVSARSAVPFSDMRRRMAFARRSKWAVLGLRRVSSTAFDMAACGGTVRIASSAAPARRIRRMRTASSVSGFSRKRFTMRSRSAWRRRTVIASRRANALSRASRPAKCPPARSWGRARSSETRSRITASVVSSARCRVVSPDGCAGRSWLARGRFAEAWGERGRRSPPERLRCCPPWGLPLDFGRAS